MGHECADGDGVRVARGCAAASRAVYDDGGDVVDCHFQHDARAQSDREFDHVHHVGVGGCAHGGGRRGAIPVIDSATRLEHGCYTFVGGWAGILINPDRELIAMGMAHPGTGLEQGMTADASLSISATSDT